MTEAEFNESFRRRLKAMRLAREWTQEQMAEALQIGAERYAKYETRSMLPLYLVPRLALLTGESVEYIVTGKKKRRPQLRAVK